MEEVGGGGSRAETLARRLTVIVLGMYAVFFVTGVVGSLSPELEERVPEQDRLILAAASVAVALNGVNWLLSVIILSNDELASRHYRRFWMIMLVVANLMASLVFIVRRRKRARS